MSAAMKSSRHKVQKATESWVEPDPIAQLPCSTGYPIDTPPPQKLLPKIKRRQTNVHSLAIAPEKISSHLIGLSHRRHNSVRDRRSRSADSEEASRSPDDSEGAQGRDGHYLTVRNSKNKSQASSNATTTPKEEGHSPSPDLQQDSSETVQSQLEAKLKTGLTEGLTSPSSMRSSLKLVKDEKEEDKDLILGAATKITASQEPEVKRESDTKMNQNGRRNERQTSLIAAKRIRSSSVADDLPSPNSRAKRQKKQNYGQGNGFMNNSVSGSPQDLSMTTRLQPLGDDPTLANDDFCSTCGGVGRFLCCESCPKSFHFSCVNPPLDEESLPEGEWFCQECRAKRFPPLPYERGLFRDLFIQLDRRNPTIFSLPSKIKDRFLGVYSNENGEYRDADMKVFKSTRSGFVEDQDLLKLTDKQGNPIFCYKCKCSSLSGVPIARCDYCSLCWHLDCLNPPLPTVKTVGTKWKCPNHADHVYHKSRRPKHAHIIDTNLRRSYKNDGNIDILDSSDEEQLEINTRDIPLYNFQNTSAAITKSLQNNNPLGLNDKAIGVKSEGVKLDFTQSINHIQTDEYSENSISQVLLGLDELATKNQKFREGVRNLCYLQFEGTPDVMAANCRTNIEMLLDSALSLKSPPLKPKESPSKSPEIHPKENLTPTSDSTKNGIVTSSTPSKKPTQNVNTPQHHKLRISNSANSAKSRSPSIAPQGNTKLQNASPYDAAGNDGKSLIDGISLYNDDILPDERNHLITIKRLMELKGKDALMEFLLPKEIER